MAYNQILKQRRISLNLTVEEVAMQTRLKPEYIRAIEDNNLDVFSDDFSYVRYFIHAYCDAIGVNWYAIVHEVDATVSAYAAARDRALSQAQARMIQSMPAKKQTRSSSRKGSRRRRNGFLKHSAGRISRLLNWDSRNRLAKTIIIAGLCAVFGLGALTYITDAAAKRANDQAKIQREEELRRKEEQTQQMAKELQNQKEGSNDGQNEENPQSSVPAPSVEAVSEDSNEFNVVYTTRMSTSVTLTFDLFSACEVLVYLDDNPVFSQEVTGSQEYTLHAAAGSTVYVYYRTPVPADRLYVDGTPVNVNMQLLASNPDAGIILHIVKAAPAEPEQPVPEENSEGDY